MTIRIILADDHPIFLDGLLRTLEESACFDVLGTACNAGAAVALAAGHRPDLALLDISMPGCGIDAARRVASASPRTRIAMLTVSERDGDVAAALRAGAIGYVLKGVGGRELVAILAGIARGEAHVSPALAGCLLEDLDRRRTVAKRPIDELTRREEDILRRVARGLSNREVAEELGITEKTVKHYMTTILEKLQARNRVEAALIAREAWSRG